MADISVRLSQINTPSDTLGRANLEDVEPGRTAEIRAGKSNLHPGQILILDADGDPDKISVEDNNRTDNVGWDVKFVGGVNEVEKVGTFTMGKAGDEKFEHAGDKVPVEFLREERDAKTHFNKAHARVLEHRGQLYFRQWRQTSDGVRHESDWFGAEDGLGLRLGSQA